MKMVLKTRKETDADIMETDNDNDKCKIKALEDELSAMEINGLKVEKLETDIVKIEVKIQNYKKDNDRLRRERDEAISLAASTTERISNLSS